MLFLCHASLTNHESQVGFVFLLEYDDGGGKHSSVSSVQHDDHHHDYLLHDAMMTLFLFSAWKIDEFVMNEVA